ncbi:MAG: hypothetical protein P8X47_02995, partial [Ignavibacteriaceae bacterium]
QAGRLRRALEKYYSNEGKNDPVRFNIPIGNYSPLFIPNLDSDSKPTEEIGETQLDSSAKPGIIVLPLTNLTGEEEQEYFAKGLTEEISIELTRYQDFRVIGFRIKDFFDSDTEEHKKLLNELGANFIIQGSVRKDKNKIKVSVRLTDAFTNEQLWGEQFKRELSPSNLISIQEDIARETVTIIANEYGIIPQRIAKESRKKAPAELDTYEAILRYYNYQINHTPETAQAAFISLEQALNKNPESGEALAMLATLYGTRYELDLPESTNALEKLVELTDKAIELEPRDQLVRIVHAWRFFVLNQKQLLDRAMKQNIGYPSWYYGATTVYYYRLNEFEKAYEEAVKYDVPALFWGPMLRAATLGQLEMKSDAVKQISDLKVLKPDFENKARFLISRYVKEEELVDKIIEGLQKAGLKI